MTISSCTTRDYHSLSMTYRLIQPPFTLQFREMPKSELKEYFKWFMGSIPERIKVLAGALNETHGYETWRPDCSPDSLNLLGEWFASQVDTRPRTEEEIRKLQGPAPFQIDVPKEELTLRTFSLAMDIGMYLSQVFLRNHPSLRWDQDLRRKMFVDYGQPVLAGFGKVSCNPVHLMVVLARGLADKSRTGSRLRELYDRWASMVSG